MIYYIISYRKRRLEYEPVAHEEIAETKSINKAAEKLFVGQSALSRAIKDLEASLGVTLFERSAKGMFPTPDGEVFVRYAKTVLKQVDAIENMFSGDHAAKTQFSISVPRASYISDAFASFFCTFRIFYFRKSYTIIELIN